MPQILNVRQKSDNFRLLLDKTMEQASKSDLHYRLTNEEWLLAWDQLKPSEVKVLYYLRTLHPWGDKDMEVGVTELAKELKFNKSTVSRALKKLDITGWIDLDIRTATIKLQTKSSTCVPVLSTDNGLPTDNGVVSGAQLLPTDNAVDRQTTPLIATQHLASETPIEQASQIPLNSLNLNRLHTPTESVCSSTSVSLDQDVDPIPETLDPSVPKSGFSDSGCEPQAIEKEPTPPPSILQSAKKLGVNVDDRQLLKAAQQFPDHVEDAIAALEEKIARVQSPTRFLVRAIKEGWQPEAPRVNITPGFGEWVREGRKRYLVRASQRVDGILKVLMACDEWIPYDLLQTLSWDEIAARFSRQGPCHVL